MAGRVGRFVRNNVVGLVALFIALGAGAYAAGLPKNSVKAKQIKAGAVKTAELADNAVTSPKVANGSLLGEDFAAGQLPQGPQGPVGADGPQGPAGSPDTPAQVLDKIKQVDGAGSGLDADTVAGIGASELGTVARYLDGNCADDAHTAGGQVCVGMAMTLPRAGRVLILGSGTMVDIANNDTSGIGSGTDLTDRVEGLCWLSADGSQRGETGSTIMFNSDEKGALSLLGLTPPLSAGAHVFQIKCSETDGDIGFDDLGLAVVKLGAG